MNILTIFANILHHRCSTGLYTGLRKYWNFQSETKFEQIIAIVTTQSVFLFVFKLELYPGSCFTCIRNREHANIGNTPGWKLFLVILYMLNMRESLWAYFTNLRGLVTTRQKRGFISVMVLKKCESELRWHLQ